MTATTISEQPYAHARERFREAGLDDRIELLDVDYRDLQGLYDNLVSIEVIEAIGSDQYDTCFAKCSELLRPGGRMPIQAITIAEGQYSSAQQGVDFIQRYIFPGGCLPSLSAMANAIGGASHMLITGVEDIGRHYALTLKHRRQNFFERIDAIRALRYLEEFIRMRGFHLTYCGGGFAERPVTDLHVVADKPA